MFSPLPSYRRHYEVPLLDDLHNYLPEILYGQPEQFGGAAPLVSYVQRQMQQRFDLFSAGRRSFAPTANPVMTPPRRTQMAEPPPLYRPPIIELNYPLNQTSFIDSLLGTVINQYMHPPAQNMMEPQVVQPTAEQVATGTSIQIVDGEGEICAICQDSMALGSESRELRCDHRFHPGCVDTWFQRSFLCPTCRHDIRVPTVDASIPPLNRIDTPSNSGPRPD